MIDWFIICCILFDYQLSKYSSRHIKEIDGSLNNGKVNKICPQMLRNRTFKALLSVKIFHPWASTRSKSFYSCTPFWNVRSWYSHKSLSPPYTSCGMLARLKSHGFKESSFEITLNAKVASVSDELSHAPSSTSSWLWLVSFKILPSILCLTGNFSIQFQGNRTSV